MSLAALQRAFIAEIAASDEDAPASSLGMEIYRQAYRGRLAAALEVSFERTRRWVGEESFAQAAAHYILTHPPHSWTLDAYGADYSALLDELFTENPEVGELAWLEWTLQQAFAAPDRAALDPAALAAAGLDEAQWTGLRFTMAAGYAARPVRTACLALWRALAEGEADGFDPAPGEWRRLVVWRRDHTPHFRLLDADEFAVLDALARERTLGEATAAGDPARLGEWLALWLGEGLFSGFSAAL